MITAKFSAGKKAVSFGKKDLKLYDNTYDLSLCSLTFPMFTGRS